MGNPKINKSLLLSLFTILDTSNEKNEVLTFPLNYFLIDILYHWIEKDPSDSRPFRWMGLYMGSGNTDEDLEQLLQKAIELGGDTRTRGNDTSCFLLYK